MNENEETLGMNQQTMAEEAQEEGVNETEAAEQSTNAEVTESSSYGNNGETEEAADPQPQGQTREANAAFASMRREVEAARRAQRELDAMYAQQFAGYTNPETGAPIRSARDYAEAMAAQARIQAREQLQEANIDPVLIDNMINNSPAMRQAKAATAELNSIRAQQMMEEDFREVLKSDPTMHSQDDIINSDSYVAVVDYVRSHPGIRFSDAYKLVNFDRLSSAKGQAAKQAAINGIKGKNHLSTGASINVNDSDEDIPASMIEMYKDAFPDKTNAELRALYNKTIASRR